MQILERQNGWLDPDPTPGGKVATQTVSCARDAERPGQLAVVRFDPNYIDRIPFSSLRCFLKKTSRLLLGCLLFAGAAA